MAVYFTSDTHFGHGSARRFYGRPFGSVREMDETLIARWNEVVGAHDEIWHLGDFAIDQPAARMAEILDRLAGRKHLIVGNNDGPATTGLGWESVAHYAELKLEGMWLVLCHYPFRSWNGMYKGSIDLHGHSHGRMKPIPRQIDVGVDVWDFRPIGLAEIREHVSRRRRRPAQAGLS